MLLQERVRAWLGETHSPIFELHRHYARQLFESDLITSPDELRRVVITCLAAVASVGFIVPKLYYKKYQYLAFGDALDLYRRAIYADQLFFVVITMLAVAAVVTFQWDSLFPSRQDYLILRTLPLKLSHIYFAKLTTLCAFAFLIVTLLTVPCAISFAAVISGAHDLAPAWQEAAAQGLAGFCAGAFVVFSLALLQTILMNILPLRWHARLSTSAQSLLLVAILCAIPWAVDLPNAVQLIDLRPAWSVYAPPLWYLGLYEFILGRASTFDRLLAMRGLISAAIVVGGTFVTNAIVYRRYAKRIFESEQARLNSRGTMIERMADYTVRDARESAIVLFALRSIHRMKQHRMIRLVYAGVGCALVLESGIGVILSGALSRGRIQHGAALDAVFALPLALFFFLFTGLRYAFRIPVDVHANWVFRLSAPDAIEQRERALRLIYFWFAVAPALITTAPFLLVVTERWKAVYGLAFACLTALLMIEHEIAGSDTIPLTCSYLPGKRNILHTGIIYWLTVFAITSVLTAIEGVTSRNRLLAAVVLILLAVLYLRAQRKTKFAFPGLRFDDLPEPAVATLGLSRE